MNTRTSARERLVCLGLLASLAAWITLILGWFDSVVVMPTDDAYYYLVIARRLAAGEGVTFDGLHATNGFHTLWLLVLEPVVRVFGTTDAQMRAVLCLQLLFFGLGLWSLGSSTAERRFDVLGVGVLVLLGFHSTKVFVCGMESALVWLLLGVVLGRAKGGGFVGICALLGLLVVTRLPLVVLALGLLVAIAEERRPQRVEALRGAAAFLAILLLDGYFRVGATGSYFPVSGAIKLRALAEDPAKLASSSLVTLAAGALFWVRGRSVRSALWLGTLLPLAVDGIVRGVRVPEIWTLGPLAAPCVLAFAEVKTAAPRRVLWLAALVVSAGSWLTRAAPDTTAHYVAARRTGEWLGVQTMPEAVVAAWDAGAVSAFSGRRVVNLDGLVNSWDYKEGVLDRGGVNAYLERLKPAYIAQYVPLSRLRRSERVRFKGVELGGYRVVHHECYRFRSAVRLWTASEPYVYLVLSRQEPSESAGLSALRGSLCREAGRQPF